MMRFYYIILFLFVGVVMIDPTNKLLHMKEIAFGLLMFVTVISQRGKIYRSVISSYSVLVLGALLSICFGGIVFQMDLTSSVSYFKALMFAIVSYAIAKLSIDEIIELNYWVGLGLSLFISIMLLSFIGGYFDMSGVLSKMQETETVMVANRDLVGMKIPMFFYKTMPFCFIALIYALRKKKWMAIFIILAPIAYGGSRTPMLMALTIITYILYDRKSKYLRALIGVISLFLLLYIVYILTSSSNLQGGDEIKGGVASYLVNNSSIFGHGVGALYWDPERGQLTSTTEVTYFEMLYQYGWLLFPFVLYIFVRPFFIMYKKKYRTEIRDFAVAYLLYLVNAGTNPLLISSTGMWVFACALTIAAQVQKEKNLSIA